MKSFIQSLFNPAYQPLKKLWNWLTNPSDAVVEVGARRQAQFLANLSLMTLGAVVLMLMMLAGQGKVHVMGVLVVMLFDVTVAYFFSRSAFPHWGAVLLIGSWIIFAFVLSAQPDANVILNLTGTIPLAFIFSSVLLSSGWQVALLILSIVGFIGFTSALPGLPMAGVPEIMGNLIVMGLFLIVTSVFRDGIERRRLEQVRQINRELEVTRDALSREQLLLRSSESRVHALLAAIPDMIFELSRDGIFLDFIPSQILMPLLPPQQFIGRNITEVMPPEVAKASLQTVEQALADTQVHTLEYQLPMAGEQRDFEARMVYCRPDSALAIIRDITGRKQTERALRDNQLLLQAVMDNIPQCIFWKDRELNYLGCNRAFAASVGLTSPSDIIGKTDWDLPSKYAAQYRADDMLVIQSEIPKLNYEELHTEPDGSTNWLRTSKIPMRNVDGNVYAVLGMYENVTKQKQSEQEREALIQELQTKNAELERFTYTVSHDLKSPLVTIRGFLGYVEKDVVLGDLERMRKDMERITNATDKMQQLLNELLELSRIGRMANPMEVIPFETIVCDAMALMQGNCQVHNVVVEVTPGMPSVYGDRVRLVEVVQNLLDNACKFMGEQPQPRIEVGWRINAAEGDKTVFYVSDNGIGIAPEHHERIFGLFNQLNPGMGGTGVGLALVKRIVEFHGGRIWVESEVGKGSTFFFTLSMTKTSEAEK